MDEAQVRAAIQAAGDALCAVPDQRRSAVPLEDFGRDVEHWHTTHRGPALRQLIGVRAALDRGRTAAVFSHQALGEMTRRLRDLRAALAMPAPTVPSSPAPDVAALEETMSIHAGLMRMADDLYALRLALASPARPCPGGCGGSLRGKQTAFCSHACRMRAARARQRQERAGLLGPRASREGDARADS
jgi:hypothetical protein